MVAAHAPAFVCHEEPDRQDVECALLLYAYHALCHVCSLTGLDEVEERMFGAVGVPKGEDGVVGEAVGLMYLHVVATILAIDVHIDAGVDHGVIERGVEERLLVVGAFYLKACQFLCPLFCGSCLNLLKRKASSFCLQVGKRPALTNGRERDFDGQLTVCRQLRLEVSGNLTASHIRKVVMDVILSPEAIVLHALLILVAIVLNGFGKRDCKVGVVLSRPTVGDAIARQERVVLNAKVRPERLSIIVIDAVAKVENELCLLCRESVLMYTDSLGCCELSQDTIVVKLDLVVTRGALLRLVREA